MKHSKLPTLADVDAERTEQAALRALHLSTQWPIARHGEGYEIATGFVAGFGLRAYRIDVRLPAPPEQVASIIADQAVERLGDWNREFVSGTVHRKLWSRPSDSAWCVQVRYRTPPPLADREYLYWLRRHDRADGIVMTYQSVDEPFPVPKGCVRAVLAGTIHRCTPTAQGTRLEHLLVNDLGGALPQWLQNYVFAGGILAAQVRDAVSLQKLFQ